MNNKNLFSMSAAGSDFFCAYRRNEVFCFHPETNGKPRRFFKAADSINTMRYSEGLEVILLSDLSRDIVCLSASDSVERWRISIKNGIWGTAILESEQAVFVSSEDARWLSLTTGKRLKKNQLGEFLEVARAVECGPGLIVSRRRESFYLENFTKPGTKMPIAGNVRFAAKSGESCVAVETFNKLGICFYENASGALLAEKCIPDCAAIHRIRTLASGTAMIVGQVAGTNDSGAWLVNDTAMEQIWQSSTSGIMDVSTNGKWALFQSGKTEIISPSYT